jgi:hypothetical protein
MHAKDPYSYVHARTDAPEAAAPLFASRVGLQRRQNPSSRVISSSSFHSNTFTGAVKYIAVIQDRIECTTEQAQHLGTRGVGGEVVHPAFFLGGGYHILFDI